MPLAIFKASLFLIFALLIGCSDDSPKSHRPTNYKSGTCDPIVGFDYKTVIIHCYYVLKPKPEDRKECKRLAVDFLNKYPEVNCTLPSQGPYKDLDQKTRIKENQIVDIIEQLEDMGY